MRSLEEHEHSENYQDMGTAAVLFEYLSNNVRCQEDDPSFCEWNTSTLCAILVHELEQSESISKLLTRTVWEYVSKDSTKTNQSIHSNKLHHVLTRIYRFSLVSPLAAQYLHSPMIESAANVSVLAMLFRALLLRCQEALMSVEQCLVLLQDTNSNRAVENNKSYDSSTPSNFVYDKAMTTTESNKALAVALQHLKRGAYLFISNCRNVTIKSDNTISREINSRRSSTDPTQNSLRALKKYLKFQPWLSVLSFQSPEEVAKSSKSQEEDDILYENIQFDVLCSVTSTFSAFSSLILIM